VAKLTGQGLSILLVAQNAAFAFKLVDYVHVMSKGRVVHSSTLRALRANEEGKSPCLGI
jgi:branched-chain amino acid transport system ATP-binding protein